jgi:hypothetical protein
MKQCPVKKDRRRKVHLPTLSRIRKLSHQAKNAQKTEEGQRALEEVVKRLDRLCERAVRQVE